MSAKFKSWSGCRGWRTRRALFVLTGGLWLWICAALRASDSSGAAAAGAPSPADTNSVSPIITLAKPGTISRSAADAMAALDDRRDLVIGDHLLFRILEDNEPPKELVVNDSGEIEAPYVGPVRVRGITCKQLALELKKELEAKYYRHATVIISVDTTSPLLGKVYISGAVRTPGPLEIPGNELFTVSKAILCAGGFATYADKHTVKITRHSETKSTNELFTVDVGQILEKGRTELDVPLKPGDMIFVPERLIRF